MNQLDLQIPDNRTGYLPGDSIKCQLHWQFEKEPASLDLALFWRTEGKGSQDSGVVQEERIENPGTRGERDFSFTLPSAPYSFSGKYITLRWGIEAISRKPNMNRHVDFMLSPDGGEILLGEPELEDTAGPQNFLSRLLNQSR